MIDYYSHGVTRLHGYTVKSLGGLGSLEGEKVTRLVLSDDDACVGNADGRGERACAVALPSARSFGSFSIFGKGTEKSRLDFFDTFLS